MKPTDDTHEGDEPQRILPQRRTERRSGHAAAVALHEQGDLHSVLGAEDWNVAPEAWPDYED